MRVWSYVVVVLLALWVPVSAAGEYGGTDPAGDVQYHDPNAGPVPAARDHPSIDIVGVRLHGETEESLTLTVEVAGEDPAEMNGRIWAAFAFDTIRYTVFDEGCEDDPGLPWLTVSAGLGSSDVVGCLEGGWLGATTFEATLPKTWIRDRSNLPLGVGRAVEGLHASSADLVAATVTPQGTISGVQARDRAPDEDVFPGMLAMELGGTAAGDLVLSTPSRLRASNGGPDTLAFPVTVANQGEVDDVVLLQATDVPQGWQVRTPARLAIPAGGEQAFPVVVTTASAHAHGSTQTFRLQASTEAGEAGALELGIHYLDIPQLAGHHSTVYFHSLRAEASSGIGSDPGLIAGEDHVPWFNTLPEQDGADEAPFRPNVYTDENGQDLVGQGRWSIPLDPALLIGMDFAPERQGALDVRFISNTTQDRSTGELRLSARLVHCHPQDAGGSEAGQHGCPTGSWFELADAGSATFQVGPDSAWTWSPDLDVTDYADLVPYVDGSNIALWIDGEMTASPFPRIDPRQSRMQLPLNEYKDPIDATFEAITSLQMTTVDPFEKEANAGQTAWFTFDVANAGDRPRTLRLDTVGHGSQWVRPVPTEPFRLDAGANRTVAFAVEVPDDAAAGMFAEVFAIVEDPDESTVAALSQIRVAVVDHPVEQEAPPDVAGGRGKESPAPPWMVVVGALALAALRRRGG